MIVNIIKPREGISAVARGNVGGVGNKILYHFNRRPGILSSGSNTINNLKAPDQ